MRNKIQTQRFNKLEPSSRRYGVADLVNADIWTVYYVSPDDSQNVFSNINFDVRSTPIDGIELYLDGSFDQYESQFETFNTRLSLFDKTLWRYMVEHRYLDGGSSLLNNELTLSPFANWTYSIFEPARPQGAFKDDFKLVQVEGLGQEVVGAGLHGLNRRFNAAVSGKDNADRLALVGDGAPDQGEAVHAGHAQVGNKYIDLVVGQDLEGAFAVIGEDGPVIPVQGFFESFARVFFVFNNQDQRLVVHSFFPCYFAWVLAARGLRGAFSRRTRLSFSGRYIVKTVPAFGRL
jgi:hypothetical protein